MSSDFTSLENSKSASVRILTVGDGDLTLSLALCRAYGNQIELIATTLCSSYDELCSTYHNSVQVIAELKDRQVSIVYGVDATHLESHPLLSNHTFNLILFHHPHLGLMTSTNSTDEQRHHQRHHALLAHYLNSAKALLRDCTQAASPYYNQHTSFQRGESVVHLCLAHDQPRTWKLEEAAHRQGLKLLKTAETCSPFHSILNECLSLTPELQLLPHNPNFSAPRRYRNGKLGSKHFLGKYGYQHRRTHGDIFDGKSGDMNVQGSKHFFFAVDSTNDSYASHSRTVENGEGIDCYICGQIFPSQEELEMHLKAPALPVPALLDNANWKKDETRTKGDDSDHEKSTSHLSQPTFVEQSAEANTPSQPCSWNVKPEHNGKRLRRFLQHVAFPRRSKKQCDILVAEGHIQVNGSVAQDDSRVLQVGDVVSALITDASMTKKLVTIDFSSYPQIEIAASFPRADDRMKEGVALPPNYLLVCNKPAGMRARGGSEAGRTLEALISWQMKGEYKAVSSVDTGCHGLCVLQLQDKRGDPLSLTINHQFTVLVHGRVPENWNHGITLQVPWKCVRRWHRQKEAISSIRNDSTISEVECNDIVSDDDDDAMMTIKCTERTSLERRAQDNELAPPLSTLQISTACQISGTQEAIILYLRKQGYPVVGDKVCMKEYGSLTRSIKNRLKKKLCMGCFRIDVTLGAQKDPRWDTTLERPEKLSALYWQRHWENATNTPKGDRIEMK